RIPSAAIRVPRRSRRRSASSCRVRRPSEARPCAAMKARRTRTSPKRRTRPTEGALLLALLRDITGVDDDEALRIEVLVRDARDVVGRDRLDLAAQLLRECRGAALERVARQHLHDEAVFRQLGVLLLDPRVLGALELLVVNFARGNLRDL